MLGQHWSQWENNASRAQQGQRTMFAAVPRKKHHLMTSQGWSKGRSCWHLQGSWHCSRRLHLSAEPLIPCFGLPFCPVGQWSQDTCFRALNWVQVWNENASELRFSIYPYLDPSKSTNWAITNNLRVPVSGNLESAQGCSFWPECSGQIFTRKSRDGGEGRRGKA